MEKSGPLKTSALDKKFTALKAKYGKSPNIIHMMWDDSGYGFFNENPENGGANLS